MTLAGEPNLSFMLSGQDQVPLWSISQISGWLKQLTAIVEGNQQFVSYQAVYRDQKLTCIFMFNVKWVKLHLWVFLRNEPAIIPKMLCTSLVQVAKTFEWGSIISVCMGIESTFYQMSSKIWRHILLRYQTRLHVGRQRSILLCMLSFINHQEYKISTKLFK